MEIRLLVSDVHYGPFSEVQVREYLEHGLLSPTDLAIYDGLHDWQPIELLLANISLATSAPDEMPSPLSTPEPPTMTDATPEPETVPEPLPIVLNETPTALEKDPSPPPPNPPVSPTTTQKTKRKINKIVIQPILPLEVSTPLTATGSVSIRKKPRTGKVAITIEPLRPTTTLPPVAGILPRDPKPKTGKTVIRSGQLSFQDFAEVPVAEPSTAAPEAAPDLPTALPIEAIDPIEFVAPAVPDALPSVAELPEPPAPVPPEDVPQPTFSKARTLQIPRWAILAGSGLALLIVGLIVSCFYFTSGPPEVVPQIVTPITLESIAPRVDRAEIRSSESVPITAADYSARGFARQAKGDLNGAVADYSKALNLDPKDVQASYRRGLALQAKGNWAGAIADYTATLSISPKNADAFSNRGFLKQAQGDLDGALADYSHALLINPRIPAAYYNEGLIKVHQGDLDGAISAYNHALDLDPKMANAYYNRGNAKNTEGNVDGAIADYTQAVALDPKIAQAYSNRGFARQSKGDLEGALVDYAQALALNPKTATALYNRGLVKMQEGDLNGAIADSSQAIEIDPKNGPAFYNRGLARVGKGDLDEALADLRKFCQITPRDANTDEARLYIWLISTEENPKGHADDELTASLLNDWNSPPEDYSSKIAAFLLGHISEDDLMAAAASSEPGQTCKGWYFAGKKRVLAGDTKGATGCFQKCLATGQKTYCEYLFAQLELQTLGQSRETLSQTQSSQ